MCLRCIVGATSFPTGGAHCLISFCAATAADEEFAHGTSSLVTTTSGIDIAFDSSACVRIPFNGADYETANFSAFDSDGFNLVWSVVNVTARFYGYLIIKGGQWEAGSNTHKTTAGTQAFTTNFEPNGLITTTGNRLTSGRNSQRSTYDIGMTDGTTSVDAIFGEEDNVMTSDVAMGVDNDECYRSIIANTPAVQHEAKFPSLNATDFTLDYGTGDSGAHMFGWIVCGDSVVAGVTVIDSSSFPMIIGSIATAVVAGLSALKGWLFA